MFRIGGIGYSPEHILPLLDPSSPPPCAHPSRAHDNKTPEKLLVSRDQPTPFIAHRKRDIQKDPPRTGPQSYFRGLKSRTRRVAGWGGRTRTSEWRNQNPLPYHLATPHQAAFHAAAARGP